MERVETRQSSRRLGENRRKRDTVKRRALVPSRGSPDSFIRKFESIEKEALSSDGIVSILRSDGSLDAQVLQDLQDDIHRKGDSLLRNPRIDYVIEYRKSVQRLLKSVIPHLHKKNIISGQKGIMTDDGPSLKRYRYTIVSKINKRIDEILHIVHDTQRDQLALLNALDEVRGLIVDLLQ